jgi:protein-tyrosine phosphatase
MAAMIDAPHQATVITPREAYNLLFESIVVLDVRASKTGPAELYPGSVAAVLAPSTDAHQLVAGAYQECLDCYGPDDTKTVLLIVSKDVFEPPAAVTSLAQFGRIAAASLKEKDVGKIVLVAMELFVNRFGFLFTDGTFKIYPNEIEECLFVGSQGCLPNLKALEMVSVLTLTERSVELPDCVAHHLHYHIADSLDADISKAIDEVVPWISDQITQGRRTLVHCEQGQSRSVSAVVAYICESRNLKCNDALAIVKVCRPTARPNEHFMEFLQERYDGGDE